MGAATVKSLSVGGLAVGAIVGLLAVAASSVLVARIWRTCGIRVNASADLLALLVGGAFMWLVVVGVWTLMFVALGRRSWFSRWASAWVTVVLVWAAVTGFGIQESYPDPLCPGNVPPWWPRGVDGLVIEEALRKPGCRGRSREGATVRVGRQCR